MIDDRRSSLGSRSRIVALSPHLDDAALSVGGYLARRVRAGASATVISVYTQGPDPTCLPAKLRVFGDYSTRLREDDRALGILGVRSERLGLSERIFREPRLERLTRVFRTPASASDFGELDTVREAVLDILDDPEVELLVPLGVGNHVDHVEVSVAALQATSERGAFGRVWFYEDFYALSEFARRRHPVSATMPLPIRGAAGWASPAAGLRNECIALFGRGPASTQLIDESLSWSPTTAPIGGAENLKLASVAEYESQTAELGGHLQLQAMLRRAHAGRGGEILWSARQRHGA